MTNQRDKLWPGPFGGAALYPSPKRSQWWEQNARSGGRSTLPDHQMRRQVASRPPRAERRGVWAQLIHQIAQLVPLASGKRLVPHASPFSVGSGRGEFDLQEHSLVALHRRPVVVPVRMFASHPPVVVHQSFHRLR